MNSIAVSGLKSEVLLHFLEERKYMFQAARHAQKERKAVFCKSLKYLKNILILQFVSAFQRIIRKKEIDILINALEEADKRLCKNKIN